MSTKVDDRDKLTEKRCMGCERALTEEEEKDMKCTACIVADAGGH